MINLIHADLYKLGKSKALKISFLLLCAAAGTLVYISHGIAVGSIKAEVSGDASGLTDIVLMGLFSSLMTGIFVCGDFESKLIHDEVACGNGRKAVVISKTFVYIMVVMLLYLPYAIAGVAGFCSGAEFAPPFVPSMMLVLIANNAGIAVTASSVVKAIVMMLLTGLVFAARMSFCLPIAFKLRKPVVVMAIGMAADWTLDMIIRAAGDIPVIGTIISYTPYSKIRYELTLASGTGELVEMAVISIVFIALMSAITYTLFRNAEIK